MKIVIIGTGNAATVLGRKLKGAGHEVLQVVGRSKAAASALAEELQAAATSNVTAVHPAADLYLLAVSDDAITEVARHLLHLPGKTLVHTAGSVSKQVLSGAAHYGVLYPLQSLKKTAGHTPPIPILVDASDEATLQQLKTLAASISQKVVVAGDEVRRKLHLAAVFCNNFVNHLYVLAEGYCRQEHLEFSILLPLIQETALRLNELPPAAAQTGPAIRFDAATLEKHRQMLQAYPHLKKIYNLFTASIQQSVIT